MVRSPQTITKVKRFTFILIDSAIFKNKVKLMDRQCGDADIGLRKRAL
jgi:hypothetical protein